MSAAASSQLILASSSPRRLELLQQLGITPSSVIPSNIDETPRPKERPADYAARMAQEKMQACRDIQSQGLILAADTVVAAGSRILDKTDKEEEARKILEILSGRRHRVYGAICLGLEDGRTFARTIQTTVQFKRLSQDDIDSYCASHEWQGKAGAYAIQGLASAYIKYIAGSYSNVVGLSLYDTAQMLKSAGYQFG